MTGNAQELDDCPVGEWQINPQDFAGQYQDVTGADDARVWGVADFVIEPSGEAAFYLNEFTIRTKTGDQPATEIVMNGQSDLTTVFGGNVFNSNVSNVDITATVSFPNIPDMPAMTIDVTPEFIEMSGGLFFFGAAGNYVCNAHELILLPADNRTAPTSWARWVE
ncbi:hypothetical protein RA27_22165 [Ruegeria sp. ANG-R]|uniref:hypothetical protein n=1 Tax=Ruegeria sp. ANG-R TaxID=1577903 RepID=UPI00058067F7|nr:hypothetical protein [Ruegeria sp. ANG-R]KIC36462.1 hypothetical protein RA27_22165 [Ruegeria sp. ANG-R]